MPNGRERQSYPASDMIRRPAGIVSRIPEDVALEAGDIVARGASLGVAPMRPGGGVLRNLHGPQGDRS